MGRQRGEHQSCENQAETERASMPNRGACCCHGERDACGRAVQETSGVLEGVLEGRVECVCFCEGTGSARCLLVPSRAVLGRQVRRVSKHVHCAQVRHAHSCPAAGLAVGPRWSLSEDLNNNVRMVSMALQNGTAPARTRACSGRRASPGWKAEPPSRGACLLQGASAARFGPPPLQRAHEACDVWFPFPHVQDDDVAGRRQRRAKQLQPHHDPPRAPGGAGRARCRCGRLLVRRHHAGQLAGAVGRGVLLLVPDVQAGRRPRQGSGRWRRGGQPDAGVRARRRGLFHAAVLRVGPACRTCVAYYGPAPK